MLRHTVGHGRAVDGVSLSINRGETLALVGESGCGKTTVGKSILRLIEASGGRVEYEGTDLLSLDRGTFRDLRQKLRIIMRDPNSAFDPRMTVRDAIGEGLEAFGIAKGEADLTRRVGDLMALVSLDPDTMYRYPHEFSGDQRQRICIALALATDSELIICDEPVSALDVSIQAQILNRLERLQTERGLTYLFITHDLGVVRYFADRVAVMYLGRIVEEGSAERIFAAPEHPYTKALPASVPSIDPDRRGVNPAALGDASSPANPPSGRRYHPRCAVRLERRGTDAPREVKLADGMSRCFLSAGEG